MGDNYTKGTDESLNIEPVNNSNNIPNEDLVDFFDTPLEESLTNLGVGETSLNHGVEVNQETEILDLNVDNVFKEAEIKIDSLDETLNGDINEDNVYDVLNKPLDIDMNEVNNINDYENELAVYDILNKPLDLGENEVNDINDNENESDVYDILNKPLDIDVSEVNTLNIEEDNPFSFNSNEESQNNESTSTTSEDSEEESISTNVQPNFMNPISNLKPISLDNINSNNDSDIEEEKVSSKAGNQEFLANSELTLVPPELNTNIDNNSNEPKDKKINKLLLAIIIVAALVLVVLGGLLLSYNRPQKIFDKAISNGFNYLSENLEKYNKYDVISGNSSISYELSSDDKNMKSIIEALNGITIDYNYAVDYKNKLMNMELNSNYNSEKLIDLSVYFENGKGYIFLKDIYEKYIVSDVEDYEDMFNITENSKDVKIILNSLKKALSKSIKSDDFIKTSETIKVNNEDVKVTSNSLVLTNKNFNRIAKDMLTKLKNDKDFINTVNKLSEDESFDAKADLEEALENIGEVNPDDKSVVKFTVYTKGMLKEFIGFNFEVKDENVSIFSIIKTGENTYNFISKEDNKIAFSGTMKLDVKEDSNSVNANVELLLNVPNTIDVKVDSKSIVKYNEPFNKVDVTNNVNVENLTQADSDAISVKLVTNPGMSKLITNIQALLTQLTPPLESGEEHFDYSI